MNTHSSRSSKVWVISDTHVTRSTFLPEAFTGKVCREDVILHLGDLIAFEVFEYLSGLCRFEAVCGNSDLPDIRHKLKPRKIVELNGLKIGMLHGHGSGKSPDQLMAQFSEKTDIILFGHTHVPFQGRHNGALIFNPGSLRQSRAEHNTYGCLHLDDEPWTELITL